MRLVIIEGSVRLHTHLVPIPKEFGGCLDFIDEMTAIKRTNYGEFYGKIKLLFGNSKDSDKLSFLLECGKLASASRSQRFEKLVWLLNVDSSFRSRSLVCKKLFDFWYSFIK